MGESVNECACAGSAAGAACAGAVAAGGAAIAPAPLDVAARLRPALAGFEPYDPAFTPCRVNLSANENTRELPAEMAEALRAAMLATPLNRYPDPMSNGLRDAIAERHGIARESICVANGGDELLFNLLFAFGGAGRALVTCPPDFAEYANFATMCETEVVSVWRDPESFEIDADALVKAAQSAALVFITSPNNPTGNLVSPDVVRRLLVETNALVLLDEAYVEFAGEDASLVGWVANEPRLMVLRTLSKAFALAGLRCGYLVADPAVIDVLAAVRQIYSVDVLAQAVGEAAVRNRALMGPVVADIVAERVRLSEGLAAIDGVRVWPSAANFVLVRVPEAGRIRARLRDECSVLVRDFSIAPGLANCLRISVGTPEENNAVLAAMAQLVKEVKDV